MDFEKAKNIVENLQRGDIIWERWSTLPREDTGDRVADLWFFEKEILVLRNTKTFVEGFVTRITLVKFNGDKRESYPVLKETWATIKQNFIMSIKNHEDRYEFFTQKPTNKTDQSRRHRGWNDHSSSSF